MSYKNYKVNLIEDWEMSLAVPEENVLEGVMSCFNRVIRTDGIINIDVGDLWALFYDKGTVCTDYEKVLKVTELQEAAAKLLGNLQKNAEKELSNVLLVIVGNVGFTEAMQAASLVQEQVGENANIVFGIFDAVAENGAVEIMLAAV